MASVGAGPSTGRRKSLDAEINLVPFIDLLSMCICFLLMTAVWLQIGSVQIKQSLGTDAPAPNNSLMEMELHFASPTSLEILLKKDRRVFEKLVFQADSAEKLVSQIDAGIAKWPGSSFSSATLTPKTGVPYGTMIGVMDVLRKHQITSLGVMPAAGGS